MSVELSSLVWRRAVLLSGIVYFIGEALHLLSVDCHLLWALGAPAGVIFGIPGIIGYAAGKSLTGWVATSAQPITLVHFAGSILSISTMSLLWGQRQFPWTEESIGLTLRSLGVFLLDSLVAIGVGVPVIAVGEAFIGYRTFVVASLTTLQDIFVPFVLLGPVILVCLGALGYDEPSIDRQPVSPRRTVAVGMTTAGWLIIGGSLSVVHRDILSFPGITQQTLREILPTAIEPLGIFILGPGYYLIQGVIAVSAVGITTSLLLWPPRFVSSA